MIDTSKPTTQSTTTTTIRVPDILWNRAKLAMLRWSMATGEKLSGQQLITEGLEIRVEQLEKKLEKAGAA